ncbi:unnamed protein product [Arabidopsis arenosa]|uniref:Uncharacterized protein n=1 Tax=Arabidopsis arenosa TaxID=38785 RepID=A0A8S1ZNM4_ARAAE|nr:unnamed protein product [Arabidopsis arenosa]
MFWESPTSYFEVAAYSDGYLRVFELLNPLELKNWQLQAEFQNVIDSLSTLGKSSSLSASVSWNPMKGEEQEPSFVLAFNSDSPHLNSSKIWEFDEAHNRWLAVAELALPEDKGDPVYALSWAPNIGRPYEVVAVATHKGIGIWHVGLAPDLEGRLPVKKPLRFPIGAANDKTRCYVYMKGSKDNSWNLNCSVILQSIANGEDSTHTHALEWKLCKSMKNKCSQVLDVQFGVSRKSLKMVAAYSDGYLWFFELLNPLELKNWQLQAKFQNVIDSLSTLGKPSSLPASVSWNPRKGEEQEPSFVFAFNSDSPHLNCAVTET